MVAAIVAAEAGARVLVLEKMNRVGKKILATGNGKCNYTNALQESKCYRGDQPDFAWSALEHFGCQDTLHYFHQLGILPKERDGYYYPASGQASAVLEALYRRLEQLGIEIHTEEAVQRILPGRKQGYEVVTDRDHYMARKVILSVGGKASPVHGSQGDGYILAGELGHHIVKPLPALTSCVLKGEFMKGWTGVRVHGSLKVYNAEGALLAEDRGELQMVAYGISGIPVFQVSRFVAKELNAGGRPYLLMDIMPDFSREELEQELHLRQVELGYLTGVDALDGMLHRKLAQVLLQTSGVDVHQPIAAWKEQTVHQLAQHMKAWKLGVKAVSDFDKAQVTCGGVDTREIDVDTMESRLCPGLYITGELLDVDGICGGYNLQWAWCSGYLAGNGAAK